ncbi:response regulator transcription factor [Mycolicibacterium frederiksbergense]|uniref:response regulator transcription factor n=1 Tax=Mycolicibacterium frederiksbergense TaxID=117567 RepID=UPI00265C6AC7|nr:LuxR C-terminal-related transcriptional regulator [Mycolicibacterium frederiksbergense]MDO0976058.1 LuxR C-terminal-related transcriptional regulator [Mycolicibacterium frederiksbergense]
MKPNSTAASWKRAPRPTAHPATAPGRRTPAARYWSDAVSTPQLCSLWSRRCVSIELSGPVTRPPKCTSGWLWRTVVSARRWPQAPTSRPQTASTSNSRCSLPGCAGARFPVGSPGAEVEVLRAIAGGATNRQVAQQLHLSDKTVGRHLANIYAKVGVSTRTAAASWAFQQGVLAEGS